MVAVPIDPSQIAEDQQGEGGPSTEAVTEPAKLLRIASMVRELLEETRHASMDEPGRKRLVEIYHRSIEELGDSVSPDLQQELQELVPPLDEGVPTESEMRVAQAQLVGWLEGLFHGIQAAMFAQQMAARQQFEEIRRRGLMAQNPEQQRRTGPVGPRAASTSRAPPPPTTTTSRGRILPASRCAKYTGISIRSTTTTATTFTTGRFRGSRMLLKMNFGKREGAAGEEVGDDDLVEGKREREQAAREHRRPDRRERHEAERLPAVGTEVHRRLDQRRRRPSEPREDVVVDDDDAERGVRRRS